MSSDTFADQALSGYHNGTHRMARSQVACMTVAAVACLALGGCSTGPSTPTANITPAAIPPSAGISVHVCTADPRAHVYKPDRLETIDPCVALTGTIELERAEPDGDYHVRLRLDPGQSCGGQPCTNTINDSQQAGDLVLEPVCENPVTQTDAQAACQGFQNPVIVPSVGSHVIAIGPFVLDTNHGWNEIHPLESIFPVLFDSPTPTTPPAPTSPSPTVAATALTVTITTSIYGLVSAVTLPGASCTAKAKLPSGRLSTAAGLQALVVAGADGAVSWSYRTESSTTHGTGTHTVTCTLNGATASASAPFTVT
jgi:hypothetical protein